MREILASYSYNNEEFNFTHSIETSPKPYPLHVHEGFELFYLISGNITYKIEGQTMVLKNGDVLVINNRELHQPLFSTNDAYERITIHFSPEYINLFQTPRYDILRYFEKRKLGKHNQIDEELVINYSIDKIIQKIHEHIINNSSEIDILVKISFVELLINLNRAYEHMKNCILDDSMYNNRLCTIIDFININLNKKLSLDLLSKKFNLSKYYLCHIFKNATGFTIIEYIQFKRITFAKELLKSGHSPKSCAISCGFEDYSAFYKTFKNITGFIPSEYLKS